ncbi:MULTISPECIES: tyrosine-type recombinase/integrase [Hymenobacter]|uniref:tyrosine-type recombinase/integrase n=1 Tax=Hymenobacter TaxID=89966 RepID=UPI001FEA372A|nr:MULTISPECIES: tyrosine-type recombinase/integrase [Hymenobacter]
MATPAGLRDRALLLLGFAGAFRRSELVALNVEHLKLTPQALLIHLDKNKTNQYGEVEDKAVFYAPDDRYCPVRSMQAWVAVLGRDTGPLLVSLKRVPKQVAQPSTFRLSDISANKLVQQHLGGQYTAHSLRASFVTIAVEAGQSNKAIKN